jgi:hypothetical protein
MQVQVPQNAKEPRLGTRRVAKLRQIQLRLAESFLREIFGVRGAAGQAEGIAVQALIMFLNKLLQAPTTARQTHGGNPSAYMIPKWTIYSLR